MGVEIAALPRATDVGGVQRLCEPITAEHHMIARQENHMKITTRSLSNELPLRCGTSVGRIVMYNGSCPDGPGVNRDASVMTITAMIAKATTIAQSGFKKVRHRMKSTPKMPTPATISATRAATRATTSIA